MKNCYLTFARGLEKVLGSYKERLWDWEGLEDWDGLGSLLEELMDCEGLNINNTSCNEYL